MVDLLCTYTDSTTCEAEATQRFSKSTGPTAQTSDNSVILSKESNYVYGKGMFLTWYRAYINSNRFTTHLQNLDIWPHMKIP